MRQPIKDVEKSTDLVTKAQSTAYLRIFEGLRSQILTGKFAPGSQLPPTKELAVAWGSSPFTIHSALRKLAKEGWIDRRHGAGTYIADPKRRFLCAGIYHAIDLSSTKQSLFARNLHFALLGQLERLNKDTQTFIDSRPIHEQGTILPSLAEAILHGRIQCLIAPTINEVNDLSLARLTLPTAFLYNRHSPNRITPDINSLFKESIRRLAAQGCRSVGLISNVGDAEGEAAAAYYASFQQTVRDADMLTRDEWIRQPFGILQENELPKLGYHEFRKLWDLPEKPDALIVYPDIVASGTVVGILETGVRTVTQRMKFIFHRNAHFMFLCPFPVTWAISDEDSWAEGLIKIIEKQFAGQPVVPTVLPYQFRDSQVEI